MAQATTNGSRAGGSAKRAKSQARGSTARTGRGSTRDGERDLSALATKAKVPAIASGAAIAGIAGGFALGARRDGSRKLLGVKLPARSRTQIATKNLAEAASHAGSFADQLGHLATEIRKVREGFEAREARSPIEVVLQGLTHRKGV